MINGSHVIIYSADPEADRTFFRDVLGLPHVDVGHGWLVFGLPPAEVAVHPASEADRHELYLMCPDIHTFVRDMTARGISCGAVQDQRWGLLATLSLPGGGSLGVYEPRHARPAAPPAAEAPRRQVVTAYETLLRAWNERDADAFAACFAKEASVIGFDGSSMDGRLDIASQLRAIFGSHPTGAYVAKVRDVRAIGPGVVLLRADVGMAPPGATALKPELNARQTAVFLSNPTDVVIAHFQNTPAAFHGRPELTEALTAELMDVLRSGRVVAGGDFGS